MCDRHDEVPRARAARPARSAASARRLCAGTRSVPTCTHSAAPPSPPTVISEVWLTPNQRVCGDGDPPSNIAGRPQVVADRDDRVDHLVQPGRFLELADLLDQLGVDDTQMLAVEIRILHRLGGQWRRAQCVVDRVQELGEVAALRDDAFDTRPPTRSVESRPRRSWPCRTAPASSRVVGSARIARASSYPSMPGMRTSARSPGRVVRRRRMSSASAPPSASRVSWPW